MTQIAVNCHFDKSREVMMATPRAQSFDVIISKLNKLDHLFKNYSNNFNQIKSLLGYLDSEKLGLLDLSQLGKNVVLEIEQLELICKVIESCDNLSGHLSELDQERFSKDTLKHLNKKFSNGWRKLVSPNGEINYEKHPALRGIFLEIKTLESSIRQQIGELKNSDQLRDALQFSEFDIIYDRYCLPIRSDSYRSEFGPIVSRSSTGHTLYIEPFAIKAISNKLMILKAQLEAELFKLYQQYSAVLWSHGEQLSDFVELLFELDQLVAKGMFCQKFELVYPEMNKSGHLKIRGLFHPLIENPVTNNLSFSDAQKGLVISGPNTGGKTVYLKSIALCHLLPHLGLFVPALSAEIPYCRDIYFFSHDHQDIGSGLSSFAAEATNYLTLLNQIDPDSVVFIDEIFNSTSSEEASALALGFIDAFYKKNSSRLFISTHHQVLKTYLHQNPNFLSCHVGYDEELKGPTYKIVEGEPGSSMALTIFESIAKDFKEGGEIKNLAEQFLDKNQILYEKLLQELSTKKAELDKFLDENRQLNMQLQNQKKATEGLAFLEKKRLVEIYDAKIKKVFEKCEDLLSQVKRQKVQTVKQFHREGDGLKKQFIDLRDEVNPKRQQKSHDHLSIIPFDEIKKEMTLFSTLLEKMVKVIETNPRKQQVQILDRGAKLWCHYESLRYSKDSREAPSKPVKIHFDREAEGILSLDCRGMRQYEFMARIEKPLYEILNGHQPFLDIVHGHGDGILRNSLHDYLVELPDLSWEYLEGNSGCTRVTLKK